MLIRRKRVKNNVKLMIISIFITVFGINVSAQNVWVKEHEPAREHISTERLKNSIGFLTDSLCQGRATGTPGNSDAAFWIRRQFENAGVLRIGESYGKRVYIGKGLIGHNVIGMMPGSPKRHPDKYIIVGAHFDHLGILDGKMYPGADANASGVVAMTSIAEMMHIMKGRGRTFDCNIIFAAFDAKEHSLAGSNALWQLIKEGRLIDPVSQKAITPEKIQFMVNIDQIGTTLSPLREGRKDFVIMLGNNSLPSVKRNMIEFVNNFYGLNMDVALSYYGSENFTKVFYRISDQRIFVDNNIPAVFFTSGITMNTNKTYDSLLSLDIPILKKRIYLIYHWIDRMI